VGEREREPAASRRCCWCSTHPEDNRCGWPPARSSGVPGDPPLRAASSAEEERVGDLVCRGGRGVKKKSLRGEVNAWAPRCLV
jgi:hypothetical protein